MRGEHTFPELIRERRGRKGRLETKWEEEAVTAGVPTGLRLPYRVSRPGETPCRNGARR